MSKRRVVIAGLTAVVITLVGYLLSRHFDNVAVFFGAAIIGAVVAQVIRERSGRSPDR